MPKTTSAIRTLTGVSQRIIKNICIFIISSIREPSTHPHALEFAHYVARETMHTENYGDQRAQRLLHAMRCVAHARAYAFEVIM